MKKAGVLLFAFVSFLLLFCSCQKTPVRVIDFTQITATSADCTIIGTPDSTDWVNDTLFTPQEFSLLRFIDTNVVITDSTIGTVRMQPVCPNPTTGKFKFSLITTSECWYKMVCVNTDMRILYYQSKRLQRGLFTTTYDFSWLTAFKKGQYYRMYYALYNARDSAFFKGHGDFRLDSL